MSGAGFASAAWPPTSIRTSPLSCWSSGSIRPALTHHPLVQVVLAWQNYDPSAAVRLGDLEVTPAADRHRTARMDLSVSMAERFTDTGEPGGIGVTVEFRTDVFDPATVEGLIERLRRVLQAMIADPTGGCRASTSSGRPNTRGSNGGNTAALGASGPAGVSVPEVFAAQVARTPDAVAVREGRSLSYAELDEAADRPAHHLVERGAGPGRCVALLLPARRAIVAILAVLKSGRLICRWTPPTRMPGSHSCSPTPPRPRC